MMARSRWRPAWAPTCPRCGRLTRRTRAPSTTATACWRRRRCGGSHWRRTGPRRRSACAAFWASAPRPSKGAPPRRHRRARRRRTTCSLPLTTRCATFSTPPLTATALTASGCGSLPILSRGLCQATRPSARVATSPRTSPRRAGPTRGSRAPAGSKARPSPFRGGGGAPIQQRRHPRRLLAAGGKDGRWRHRSPRLLGRPRHPRPQECLVSARRRSFGSWGAAALPRFRCCWPARRWSSAPSTRWMATPP
mmetsp:Transcript_3773/g.9555  ORF Transcript_3773/g.9555 Transcript_3773/m.9555 type:complete len:251 (-) Transcript_3773:474-1226(-)